MMRHLLHQLSSLLLLLVCAAPAFATAEPFPIPPGFEPRINFWVDVFCRYSTSEVIIHSREKPWEIYEILSFEEPFDPSNRRQLRRVRQAQKRTREGTEARFQAGLRERFAAGIERSGRYLPAMRAVFEERGLPTDLTYLPHVESAFRNNAHSAAACVGLWQWSRGTGKLYLAIDRGVDERFDPYAATIAAAEHLQDNLEELGSWPLAITAYNHGVAGMRRAGEQFGADHFDRIVDGYRSRTFGFASKNFYAEFLAARRVARDPERYFDDLQIEAPWAYDEILIRDFLDKQTLNERLALEDEEIRAYNPGLRAAFYAGRARVPRNYMLHLPPGRGSEIRRAYAAIPAAERHQKQIPHHFHVVRAGENLSLIAHRYGTSVRSLTTINELRSPHRIYAGQRLRVR